VIAEIVTVLLWAGTLLRWRPRRAAIG
jgi:hypothetical protein